MLRAVAAIAAAAFVLAATHAWANEDYVDRTNGFRVTVPTGWQKYVSDELELLDLVLISPRFDTSSAMCAIGSDAAEETRSLSQDQINEAFLGEVDTAFWTSIIAGDQTSNVVIDEARSEVRNGRRVFYAIAHYTEKGDEGDVQSQSQFALHLIPGQMMLAHCQAQLAQAPGEQADFKIVLDSSEPLGVNVVAALRPRRAASTAALVLYAGPLFDGPRRALANDVADLARAGWGGWTGSFALKGGGLWQICDGINYAGNCRVIAGAAAAKLGDRALRIGSARRVVGARDPRVVLGLIADTAAAAKRRPRKPHRR